MSDSVKIGSISYFPDNVIGEGSFGTRVYRGKVGEGTRQAAAIKIVPLGLLDMKEVKSLESLQEKNVGENMCPFIVKYLLHEVRKDSPIPLIYLAIELCSGTLDDFVNCKKKSGNHNIGTSGFDIGGLTPKLVMNELTQATSFLHSHGIIHRDIKPRNCLISQTDKDGKKIMKLSDFGLCGVTSQKTCSTNTRSLAIGSYGWMAPEVAVAGECKDSSLDIFSLGCVYFYVLSNGRHIFNEDEEGEIDLVTCQKNINRNDLRFLLHLQNFEIKDFLDYEKPLVRVLIQKMVSSTPRERPSADDILHFPLFLEKKELKIFLHDIGNMVDVPKCKCKSKKVSCTCGFEKKITPQAAELLKTLNETDSSVIKGNWYKNLEVIIQKYCLTAFNKKDGENLVALCRAIRNNIEHFAKYQGNKEVLELFGSTADGVIDFYFDKFPDFLSTVYTYYHDIVGCSVSKCSKRHKIKIWRVTPGLQQSETAQNIEKHVSKRITSEEETEDRDEDGGPFEKKPTWDGVSINKTNWIYVLTVFVAVLSLICAVYISVQITNDVTGISDTASENIPQSSQKRNESLDPSEHPKGTNPKNGDGSTPSGHRGNSSTPYNEGKQPYKIEREIKDESDGIKSGTVNVEHSELEITEEIKKEFPIEAIISDLSGFLGDGMKIEKNLFGRNFIIEMSLYLYRFKTYHNVRVTDIQTGARVNSKDRKKCLGKSCAIENGIYSIVEELKKRGIDINIV